AIYRGVLRYGRPAPSYARTTEAAVVVDLNSDKADLEFLQLVLEQENETGQPLPLSTLHLLSTLRRHRRVDAAELAEAMGEVAVQDVKAILEHAVEAGLVEAHGVKKGRTYTLSAKLYGKLGQKVQYVRQTGLSSARQKALVLTHAETHGTIKRDEVVDLCGLNPNQATKLLSALTKAGELIKHGEKRGSYYTKTT
ncbi:MAG: crosslink repair DNA glycosylase YcaQ family protein, partial [Hyphomicrobium sp.]